MATRFELVLHGDDRPRLRAAGEEALRLIQRLDAELSCYRATSAVSRINARAGAAPVAVEPALFELLLSARRLHQLTAGAFDITIGPLLRCWGLAGRDGGRVPDERALAEARALTGMHLVELDERRRTVRFARPGVTLDLGAIGKGYALEQAARTLRELGIASALLHGGTSSVCALGAPPGQRAWQVAIRYPRQHAGNQAPLALVPLLDRALGLSAVWGKSFMADGVEYGHVLDPRAGAPVQGARLAAVVSEDGTAADALSTALLVLGPPGGESLTAAVPGLAALVLERASDSEPGGRVWASGITVRRHGAGQE